jgi:Sulfotransferase family
MFVREPLDRLRSAYAEKFQSGNNLYNQNFGRRIIARYRQNASNESLTKGHDVTHEEFVKYIIDPK